MINTTRIIYCIECGKEVNARLTNGTEIYPFRPDLSELPFWKCDVCHNFVGCHHKTENRTQPLGYIPNAKMKEARKHIHKLLDPLWKTGKIKRKRLYSKLSKFLGRTYHTAELRSVEEARDVYRYLLTLKKSLDD